ncbi:GTP cyclohydrolase I FolE2 [bacterium]|nr:GTP cyclohydrolase I FolE2 [bacterium]
MDGGGRGFQSAGQRENSRAHRIQGRAEKVKDVQNQPDARKMSIDRVGVTRLRYPVTVLDRKNGIQHTVGDLEMTVSLPHHFRGTHMSRFIEILNEHHRELHIDKIGDVLEKMKSRLEAEEAHIRLRFPYFIEKAAPATGAMGLVEYTGLYEGSLSGKMDFMLGVEVPVTTLCPCSKEISESGAHNQRSIVRIRIRYSSFVWLEDLIETAEACASSPVYSLLKREDEKAVTETAYSRPMFAEDMVRDIALKLEQDPRILWYGAESENMESIHNHNAFASIERWKTGAGRKS